MFSDNRMRSKVSSSHCLDLAAGDAIWPSERMKAIALKVSEIQRNLDPTPF